jgi:hypothetical protein
MTLLDRFLPVWNVRETHGIRIDAPAERMLAAVREATPADAPLLRALFVLRGLPAGAREPIWEQLAGRAGFAQLAEEAGVEVVAGAIGRPWSLFEPLRRGLDFEAFDDPGYAKMALGFHAGDGVLTTETRVLLTDDEARRRFARYWRVVGPLSSITRRSWLAAAKKRAESPRTG